MLQLWIKGLLARRSGRAIGAIIGLGLTVALVAAIGTFTVTAARTMTQRAISGLPVDWQIQLLPPADPASIQTALSRSVRTTALAQVGYADTAGFKATTGQTEQTAGPGKVVGVPPDYTTLFPDQIQLLLGSWRGALIAQQTAANLHVGVGDTVLVEPIGLAPVSVSIAGVVALPNADSMFQRIGIAKGGAPQAPPDNVLILPQAQFHAIFDAQATMHPSSTQAQLHVRLAHTDLPPDPEVAMLRVQHEANNFEARVAGSAIVGDNLAARLDGTRADALYARVLFLFLGLPGVLLAACFTLSVAASGAERRQAEQALLRTRGASAAQILSTSGVEAAVIGAGGVVVGIAIALLAAVLWWRLDALLSAGVSIGTAAAAGLVLAATAILLPAWKQARWSTVAASRIPPTRSLVPLWQRLFADFVLLLLAGLTFALVASSGYQVVVAPEGVAQSAVHYDAFLAPLGLWVGAVLLTMRLTRALLLRGRALVARTLAPLAGNLAPIIAASMSRQRDSIARGVALVALAFAFAVSTAVFDTTYKAQAHVDAQLTNGADVTVTGTTAAPAGQMLPQLAALPGVVAAQPMLHRYAYVGTDLQDLYGIDPNAFAQATTMSDAYFTGATARHSLGRLAVQQDGILVSEETVRDFQLQPGDLLNLRLQTAADRQFHIVPFHYAGMVREFPTAPKDSFLVANTAYVTRMTGAVAAELVLLRTNADPAEVAAKARTLVASLPGATVTTLDQAQRLIASNLTAVDLRGLMTLELGFAVLMIAGVTGLVLALGLAERRRSFTVLSALGAKPRQLGAFLWSEALVVVGIGGLSGTAVGFTVAGVLVRVLSGVFDPPPQTLSVPWLYLLIVAAAATLCTSAAIRFTALLARRPDPLALRRS